MQKDQNRNEWKMPLVTAESERDCMRNRESLYCMGIILWLPDDGNF